MGIGDQTLQTREEQLQFASQFDGALLYKTNAFRLLQLPVTATDREITRRKQMCEISTKTQAPIPDGRCKLFSINLSEAGLDVNLLVDSLRDPVQRFYQEFFWFWPLPVNKPGSDPAFLALAQGDLSQALETWTKQSSDPKAGAIGLHNLAVFNHFTALENSDKSKEGDAAFYWESTFKNWKDLAILSDFWSLLENRVRDANDPRLTLNHVKNLRQAALSIISFTNAKEAARLAEDGNPEGARSLLLPLTNTLGENDFTLGVLKLAIVANRERLEAAASFAEEKAKNDPAHADGAAEALLTGGGKQLEVIRIILPKNALEFNSSREDIFEHALQGINAFFGRTNDWERAIELVEKTRQFALSANEKENIQKRLTSLREFGNNQHYWCCKGYYNNELPPVLFGELEEARKSYDLLDFDTTIQILEEALKEFNYLPDVVRKAIHPPLALTLDRKARDLVTEGMDFIEKPRQVVQRILQNLQIERCMNSYRAVLNDKIQYYGRLGQLYCMACLSNITGTFYIGESDKLKFIICSACNIKDQAEKDSFKKQALPVIYRARDYLQRANFLQSENKVVADDLEALKKILQNVFNISIPGPARTARVSAAPPVQAPVPKPRAVSDTKQVPKTNTDNALIIAIVAIFLILIIICIASNQSNMRPAPTSSNSYTAPIVQPPAQEIQLPTPTRPTPYNTLTFVPTQTLVAILPLGKSLQPFPGSVLIASSTSPGKEDSAFAKKQATILALPPPLNWEFFLVPATTGVGEFRNHFIDPQIRGTYLIGMDGQDSQGIYLLKLYKYGSVIAIQLWPDIIDNSKLLTVLYSGNLP